MQALFTALGPLLKHPMFIGLLKNASAAGITVQMLLGIGKYLIVSYLLHLVTYLLDVCKSVVLTSLTSFSVFLPIAALGFVAMLMYLLHTLMNAADTVALSPVEFRSFQLIAVDQVSPDTKKLKFALQVSAPALRRLLVSCVRCSSRQLATVDCRYAFFSSHPAAQSMS